MRATINRRSRLAAVLIAGALGVTACGESSERGDTAGGGLSKAEIYATGYVGDEDAGDPVKGGTLTVAEYAEIRSLNPTESYANGAVGGSAMAAVYDTLTRYDFESGTWEPQLAESLTSDDKVTWTLALREGVTFSDGTPLDADAVIGSIELYTSRYAYQSLQLLGQQTKMRKVDDLTVEFTHRSPWATFPAMLAGGPGMIMAPAAYANPEKFEPIGAGPFELEKYAPAEELVLAARDDYWNGAPYLDKLRFVWLGADDAKMQSMDAGEADAAFIRSAPVVEKARKDGYSGMMLVVGMGSQIAINMREGRPGEDERVRKAIQLAFDNEAYLERASQGAGLPSKSIFAETSPWSTGVEVPAVDREAAADLVEEARADGFDGKLDYLVGADPLSQNAAVQVEAQLEAVGFDITIVSSDNIADSTKRLYVDHDFDIALSASSIGDEDPYGSLGEVLFSTSPTNLSGYANPEMDQLLGELGPVGDDPSAGVETMRKIEELFQEEVPSVLVSPVGNFLVTQDEVHGIKVSTQALSLYDKAWKG
ncbi:MAG TPA: ABC transporter substrate-binding protein [Nocardioides sp.]|nr:ABC transporter substrate-binding protein [Nocardioides sp.]